MRLTRLHVSIAAGALAAATAVGVLSATADTNGRGALLAQLERPAGVSRAHPFGAVMRDGRYRVSLAIRDNRAGASEPLAIAVSDRDRPVSGARVAVSYSMPSMAMENVYTSRLHPNLRAAGQYRGVQAILGMAGTWRLRITVTPQGAGSFSVPVADRMGA